MKSKWMRGFSVLMLCCLLAGFFPGRASAAAFRDVPAKHWAADSISRCATQGYFQGTTEDTFGLGQFMTRCAAVVVLDRFFGWEEADFSLPYEDVPADAWYAGALRSAYAKGVVTVQSRKFRPADPITREELAVMLIRALGYTEISGVAQSLPQTFTDIDKNLGYIAMARDFGLVSGIRTDTFAPERYASREQVAVILMRLYDKLQGTAPVSMEIVSSVTELSGMDTVAVKGAMLTASGTVREILGRKQVEEIRTAAGVKEQLLYVSGTSAFLSKKAGDAAENLADVVAKGGYNGLVLEISGVSAKYQANMTAFMKDLNAMLDGRKLVLVLPAPVRAEDSVSVQDNGYDYAALGEAVDQLVLQMEQSVKLVNKFPVAPVAPLEEIYWGLAQLRSAGVTTDKVSLMLTAEGVHYSGKSERDRLSGQEIQKKLKAGWNYHYSERYGCAYLEKKGENEAVWYLDGTAAADRLQLLKLLGVGSVCMETPAAALPEVLDIIR